jgi:pSer/pThr/pTyr-binding forkhead associated (FHA) protein
MTDKQYSSSNDDERKPTDTVIEPDPNSPPTRACRIADFAQTTATVPQEQAVYGTLIVEQTPDRDMVGKVAPINHVPFNIGREGCDLEFRGAQGISRKHARITFENGDYFIADSGSTNHTFVDNVEVPVNCPRLLQSGNAIRLGAYTILRFEVQKRGPRG